VGQALRSGRFITFEGGEGAGKSTQIRLLAEALQAAGIDALATREPGGAPGAEEIRKLLLSGAEERWDVETEALLMVAARRNHLVATVWPALDAGRIVLCDRFADSTEAYQGWGRGLARERIVELHRLIADGFAPDLTLILDLPVAEGLARTAGRAGNETRFERMPLDFHERMRLGFLDIARREPERCRLIDARGAVESVHRTILAEVRGLLKLGA
jgi:dTMP kinase